MPLVSTSARAEGGTIQAIEAVGITHCYPSAQPGAPAALEDVSLAVNGGEIFGVLGPNGGGKTTLFRILSTLLRPDEGTIRIFGDDLRSQAYKVRQSLGVVFQSPSLDGQLTAYENLMHQGHLYGLRGKPLVGRIHEVMEGVNLADRMHERVGRFSGGMRRRVELAKALLHRPRLLLLDEPATGLDPGVRRDVWAHLRQLRETSKTTIVLTTHLMDEADRCDRLAILSQGRMVAVDKPAALKARIGGDVVILEPLADDPEAAAELCREATSLFAPWEAGTAPQVVDGRVRMERPNGAQFVAKLVPALAGRIRSVSVGQPTLEDVFIHLTGQGLSEDAVKVEGSSRG